ncbi:SCAN domain-containing protein 3, partial [Trichonephila clavipes]
LTASMASTKKKKERERERRTEKEHREFNRDSTKSFTFIYNSDGFPTCLIFHEKLAHNKKLNLERHFTTKHAQFTSKYPAGEEQKKAVDELQKQKQHSSSILSNWSQSTSNVNLASLAVSLEIAKKGKPFTGDESCDIKNTAQVAFFVGYMSPQGTKEEILGLLPLSGQTRGEDIPNAVQKCLEDNKTDINKIISIATDGARKDIQSSNLLQFQFLKQYRDKTGATVDTNYFSTVIKKIKAEFADRFEQFKTNKTTLAFIVNTLNTNSNEIHIEPFGIDTGSLEKCN